MSSNYSMPMKLNVWVFQTGEPLHIDGSGVRAMRAINLTDALIEAGHSVVLWSTDFDHQRKLHRFNASKTIDVSDRLQVRLLSSPGYQRNIGFGRIYDHFQLARLLKQRLRMELNRPDVAFIGYPPIETAAVMSKWLKNRNIPALLDVKDQWPSLFLDALPKYLNLFGRVVFYPYFRMAKSTMRNVTGISTMSDSFLNWAINFSGRKVSLADGVFPLTTAVGCIANSELQGAEQWWDELGVRNKGCVNLCFVGSLSPAFDFGPIREAARLALDSGNNIKFVICGDGGDAELIRVMMKDLPNVIFPGWIDRAKVEVLSKRCKASLAPYLNTDNFTMNIPNKIIDSLALGLPILSPLYGEVRGLIEKHRVGLSYESGSGIGLFDCIRALVEDESLCAEFSNNARLLYSSKFEFEQVYSSLVRHLEKMAQNQNIKNSDARS